MNRRLAALVVAALVATTLTPSPARAADSPISDIGIAAGTVLDGPVALSPTVAEGADLTRIQLEAIGEHIGDYSFSSYGPPWVIDWDPLASFRDEEVTLTMVAYERDGGWSRTAPVTVYVDHWGPEVRIDETTINGHAGIHHPIAVTASDRAGLDRVELYQNGKLVRTDRTLAGKLSGGLGLPLDPATRSGRATLGVRVYDRFGNLTNNDFSVLVDNDRPIGSVSPTSTYLRGTITATLTDVRDATGVSYLASYLDDRKGYAIVRQVPWAASWSVRVNTHVVKDGAHSLYFDFADPVGNRNLNRRTVYIDNTAPSIAYSSAPKNNAKLTGKVAIKATAADRFGVARVQLLVNGKVVATDSKAGYAFTLNPKKYGKKFTVRLRAYDRAGNVRYTATRTYRR